MGNKQIEQVSDSITQLKTTCKICPVIEPGRPSTGQRTGPVKCHIGWGCMMQICLSMHMGYSIPKYRIVSSCHTLLPCLY